jgi:ParB family chromosome partitioning protein
MTLTTVPLSALRAPKDNPRKVVDKRSIPGLAQSIRVDGILQNLVVRPEGEGAYRIIFGKRRHLALQRLKKEGAIDGTYPVPVDIKDGIDDHDARRLATVENAQREQLHPLDEAEDFAALLQSGGTLESITEKTGLSATTVKRRLAVATLAPQVKRAFRAGTFGRGIAEALTLGSHEQQRAILESLQSPSPPDADDIRNVLIGQKPTLAMAIFPRERYTDTITTDLFADDETSYFDDVDRFLALQREAVEALAEERRKTAPWVDVLSLYTVPWWQYRDAADGAPSGVVINLHPSGEVEIRDGLAKHEVEPEVVHTTRASPMAPRPPRERPPFTSELLRYVALQRSAAVQATLLADPRKAKEAGALLLLLGLRRDFGVRLNPHACHGAGSEARHHSACQAIVTLADELANRLGFVREDGSGHDPGEGIGRLMDSPDGLVVYEAVRQLPDADLDRLLMLLPILCLGQEHVDAVDEGDTLFNLIAKNSGVRVRQWWKPDAAFLALLTREQLLGVATECGAAEHLQGINGWTKKRMVEELAVCFETHAEPESVPDADRRACDWLPGILMFPAVKSLSVTEAP